MMTYRFASLESELESSRPYSTRIQTKMGSLTPAASSAEEATR
jgi:hypothetical protein